MKSLDTWLQEYASDHRDPQNQIVHKVCVPMIFFSIVGALHLIPYEFFDVSIGDWFSGLVALTYLRWGFKAFALIFAQWFVALVLTVGIANFAGAYTIWILLGVFAFAWVGQFIGHGIEGKRPSFLTDLQYLLIGPLWVWLGH